MGKLLTLIFWVIGITSALLAGGASAEPISLNGSTTVMNTLIEPNKAEIEAAAGQQIVVTGNGSQRGLVDLISGKAQIAMISAPLELEVEKINAKQPGSIDLGRLNAHPVGEARVAFVVHPSNSVRRPSRDQLKDVLIGNVRNWREVGGQDQPIIIVTAQPGDGLRTMVENELLKGGELPKDTRVMTNATQIVRVVAQVPGAIGIVAAISIDASVAELKNDAQLTQPLILVTIGEETLPIRQIIDAVAKDGKLLACRGAATRRGCQM